MAGRVVNRGARAGGAGANANGLPYENMTDLSTQYTYNEKIELDGIKYSNIRFNQDNSPMYKCGRKQKLHTYMKSINERNNDVLPLSGCKEPDEAYIDTANKLVVIIEKKFQQGPGSVDEKIQAGHVKLLNYSEMFPNYSVKYIFCLSDWFKRPEYINVLDYLRNKEIPIFWGNDADYKNKIITYMLNASTNQDV